MKTLIVSKYLKPYISESDFIGSEIVILEQCPEDIKGYKLIIWDSDEYYPVKDKGSVLICVERGQEIGEALSKVFQMKANAVIVVNEQFELIDALGNLWVKTASYKVLFEGIIRLYTWNKGSQRRNSVKSDTYIPYDTNVPEMVEFCDLIKDVSNRVEKERGGRYFGNASTRCSKMFPSIRSNNDVKENETQFDGYFQYILVSKRNISKDKIQPDDFVVTRFGNSSEDVSRVLYFGEDKPSVDTPGQIMLYQRFPKINFMIHGHAYISCKFLDWNLISKTENYCSCGDLRETTEIEKYFSDRNCNFFIINLTNHGFIIATDTLERMKSIIEDKDTEFIYRNIGEEIIYGY